MYRIVSILILIVGCSCSVPLPPSIPILESQYVDEWHTLVAAWESYDSLPGVPEECNMLHVSIIQAQDVGLYDGPNGNNILGYLTVNVAVIVDRGQDEAENMSIIRHEMTHWLAYCTGLHRDSDNTHMDPRLWDDLN